MRSAGTGALANTTEMDVTSTMMVQTDSPSVLAGARLKTEPARVTSRVATTALLVALAYYAGANLGFILRFPPMTPSVLWPPNSILTATLLLAPRRRWWIYLLAALPAHLIAELQADWPTPLVLALFATNCTEAVIAAGGVRRFSDAPTRFDTLDRVAVFLFWAVLAAPFLSSFMDAAAVSAFRGEPYWLVWRTRLFSNVLTALTVVPTVVIVARAAPALRRRVISRRGLEAVLLTVLFVSVGIAVFAQPGQSLLPRPGTPILPLAFLFPFILWAAVRFGPGGSSLSLLASTLFATWAATHDRGPFAGIPVADGVLVVQISIALIAIPVMCLAALIAERRCAEQELANRLRFEELLSRLSGVFVQPASHEMDRAFEVALGQLGTFLALDRVTLTRPGGEPSARVAAYSWAAPNAPPAAAYVDPALTIPLIAGGRVLGTVDFATRSGEGLWFAALIERLHLVAEVLANALARKETEDALRASDAIKSAILTSLTSSVAVLDREGRIIAVNESWKRLARENGGPFRAAFAEGTSYVEACRSAASPNTPDANEALAGVEAVLDRTRAVLTQEYAVRTSGAERWFTSTVVPLDRPEGGAVISHTEITERKLAEMDAQHSRQELAHFTRVSAMGELTASLAHELNQPLTGILTNAQAARRFLDATPPALGELREILSDIIDDDKRAAEVIRRLRDLLTKGEPHHVLLDLNTLIREVAKLVSSDAIIRNVVVRLDCDPDPPVVSGDRIQLQQVVLNLLLNAMEAIAQGAADDRTVVVRTQKNGHVVRVSVQDTGPGLSDGIRDLVFEPFYTTKPAGMGMGLSIARSIVKIHDGVIWATNNAPCGATFHVDLPLAGARPA